MGHIAVLEISILIDCALHCLDSNMMIGQLALHFLVPSLCLTWMLGSSRRIIAICFVHNMISKSFNYTGRARDDIRIV